MAVEFKLGVVKTEGYKGLDCGSRYVGWKEMGFVLEVEYGGREGFLHVLCSFVSETKPCKSILLTTTIYESFEIGPCFPYLPTCRRCIVQPYISFLFLDMKKVYN